MLPFGLTEEALGAAAAETDPDSLGAGDRLRARFGPDLAAAALTQSALRRKAVAKFGHRAAGMFFTRDGLEQASRPAVAAHHAMRFRASGVDRVVDLGCGIGADAMAFLDAGLAVRAVEVDPATAAVAVANLTGAGRFEGVTVGDAEQQPLDLLPWGYFADPARRDRTGRVWRIADFTPSWSFVLRLLDGGRVAGIKLGPALPHGDIPAGVEAEWVTHDGSTVEAALWAGGTAQPDARRATVLGPETPATLLVAGPLPAPGVAPARQFVYEPDGSVIRAGAIPVLAADLDATLLDPRIAYLSADRLVSTPFARAYEVLDRLPYAERTLRQWVRHNQIGTLEIKQRGIDLDPAVLRKRLAPRGPNAATLLITRTPKAAVALVVRRA